MELSLCRAHGCFRFFFVSLFQEASPPLSPVRGESDSGEGTGSDQPQRVRSQSLIDDRYAAQICPLKKKVFKHVCFFSCSPSKLVVKKPPSTDTSQPSSYNPSPRDVPDSHEK